MRMTRLSDAEEIRIGNQLAAQYAVANLDAEQRATEQYLQRVTGVLKLQKPSWEPVPAADCPTLRVPQRLPAHADEADPCQRVGMEDPVGAKCRHFSRANASHLTLA